MICQWNRHWNNGQNTFPIAYLVFNVMAAADEYSYDDNDSYIRTVSLTGFTANNWTNKFAMNWMVLGV